MYSLPQLPPLDEDAEVTSQSEDTDDRDGGDAPNGREEGEGVARARVWTRKRLAELCGISESQVVEWAILMGNDYTRELSFSGIGFGSHKKRRPEQVRSWYWGLLVVFVV